jgi:hypothetical protein
MNAVVAIPFLDTDLNAAGGDVAQSNHGGLGALALSPPTTTTGLEKGRAKLTRFQSESAAFGIVP